MGPLGTNFSEILIKILNFHSWKYIRKHRLWNGCHFVQGEMSWNILLWTSWLIWNTVYPEKYAHGFCFAVLCCGYTLTHFPISTRLTSLALWQSNDCPSASKATLMNMDKYFMWVHYERLHNHNKAKHNKTVCIFLGIYCNMWLTMCLFTALRLCHVLFDGRSIVSWDGFTWEPLPYYWCFVLISCQWCCLNTLKLRQNAILQKKFSNAFFLMKMDEFLLRLHWNLFIRVQLTLFHQWFR